MADLYYRKLWFNDDWSNLRLTSLHDNAGVPPDWLEKLKGNKTDINEFQLATNSGVYSEAARDHFFKRFVTEGLDPASLTEDDRKLISEQAGLFVFRSPMQAYWYGVQGCGQRYGVFEGELLGHGAEPTSLILRVTKKVEMLTECQFIENYLNGQIPPRPTGTPEDRDHPFEDSMASEY